MTGADEASDDLRGKKVILLIDWPSRDVPDTLARAGLTVVSDEGPTAGDVVYATSGADVMRQRAAEAPTHADVVYAYRPIEELPEIVDRARALGAQVVWLQSGLDTTGKSDPHGCWLPANISEGARNIVESAGLIYRDSPYIADTAREIGSRDSTGPPG